MERGWDWGRLCTVLPNQHNTQAQLEGRSFGCGFFTPITDDRLRQSIGQDFFDFDCI